MIIFGLGWTYESNFNLQQVIFNEIDTLFLH